MLSTPTNPDAANREPVKTSDPPGYPDQRVSVEDFDQIRRFIAEHPNQGSEGVSTALDLPPRPESTATVSQTVSVASRPS
jgi:hypothetical protein